LLSKTYGPEILTFTEVEYSIISRYEIEELALLSNRAKKVTLEIENDSEDFEEFCQKCSANSESITENLIIDSKLSIDYQTFV